MVHIHPHIGFLNTDFRITSDTPCNISITYRKFDNLNEVDDLAKNPITYHLQNGKTIQHQFHYAGEYVVKNSLDDTEEVVTVKDAIKLGGSTHKASYVFEGTPWVFVVMKDRTYFHNRDTEEEYVESISPDSIEFVNANVVLMGNEAHNEYSLYSLTLHKPIYQFNKHIYLDADNIVIIQIPRTTQQISGVLNGNETLDVGKTRTTKDGYIAYGSLQEFKDAMAKHYSYPALSKESIKPVLNRKDNTCFFIHCNTHVCLGACSDNLKAAMSANQAITAKDLAGFKAPNGPFILGLKGVEEETPIVLSVCKIYSDKVESVSFECLHYSIDKQRRCAYFVQNNIVNEVSFDTLDKRMLMELNDRIIGFTNSNYIVTYQDTRIEKIFDIYNVCNKTRLERITSQYPITSVEGTVIEEIDAINKEFNNESRYSSIKNIIIVKDIVYYLINTTTLSVDENGITRTQKVLKFKDCKSEVEVALSPYNIYHNVLDLNGIHLIESSENPKRCLLLNEQGELIDVSDFTPHVFKQNVLFSKSLKENKKELYLYRVGSDKLSLITSGEFNWDYFDKFGVLQDKCNHRRFIFFETNELHVKVYPNNGTVSISNRCSISILSFGGDVLVLGNLMLYNKDIMLPQGFATASENCSFVIGFNGSSFILYELVNSQSSTNDKFVKNRLTTISEGGFITYGSIREFNNAIGDSLNIPNLADQQCSIIKGKTGKYYFAHSSTRKPLGACSKKLQEKLSSNFPLNHNELVGYQTPNGVFILGLLNNDDINSQVSNNFTQKEIFKDLFDNTKYSNVLLSDDGKNILYQQDNKLILMNPQTMRTEVFPNQYFISHINGNRPLFKVDNSHRRARLFDPISQTEVHQDYLVNYCFVSPDNKLYAGNKLSEYTKFYNCIEEKEISRMEYDALKEQYKASTEDERKAFMQQHAIYFDGFNNSEREKAVKNGCYLAEITLKVNAHARIYSVQTDEVIAEIELGPELWFLNYVSFSYDSRYVAIAGRYPDSAIYSGLFLVYDLSNRKEVIRVTDSYAIWRTAFTQSGLVVSYSSTPITYIQDLTKIDGTLIGEDSLPQLDKKSFLAFSPDGALMALSKQGYIRYSVDSDCWGHQPSTEVFIYATDPLTEIVSYNDLSDGEIQDMYSPTTAAAVSFSMDGNKLMMVGNDGTVIIRTIGISLSDLYQ